MKKIVGTIEVLLYFALFADLGMLLVGVGRTGDQTPIGGVGFLVIVFLISGARRVRVGKDYSDPFG